MKIEQNDQNVRIGISTQLGTISEFIDHSTYFKIFRTPIGKPFGTEFFLMLKSLWNKQQYINCTQCTFVFKLLSNALILLSLHSRQLIGFYSLFLPIRRRLLHNLQNTFLRLIALLFYFPELMDFFWQKTIFENTFVFQVKVKNET